MRTFVILGHDAPTTADFALDDLPGAGRLDILCRCLGTAFLRSHGIRTDVRVFLVLGDSFTLRFEGETLQRLNPDERSTGALIRNALDQREEAIGRIPVETSPGVFLVRGGFSELLADVEGTLIQLHEEGTPVVDVGPPEDPVFVLSDHQEFWESETAALADMATAKVSLGPEALHADQAITVAHNWLDTAGFTRY